MNAVGLRVNVFFQLKGPGIAISNPPICSETEIVTPKFINGTSLVRVFAVGRGLSEFVFAPSLFRITVANVKLFLIHKLPQNLKNACRSVDPGPGNGFV